MNIQHSLFQIPEKDKYSSCDWQLSHDEIWLGNTSNGISEDLKVLKTIRLGEQAYCIHGKKLDPSYCLPLILNKSEEKEYDRIYAKRISDIHKKYNTDF